MADAIVRLARADEEVAAINVICEAYGCEPDELASFTAFVHENYITDGPGYAGPVLFLHWPAAAANVSVLCRGRDGAWFLAADHEGGAA
jgi:hypothetical protein